MPAVPTRPRARCAGSRVTRSAGQVDARKRQPFALSAAREVQPVRSSWPLAGGAPVLADPSGEASVARRAHRLTDEQSADAHDYSSGGAQSCASWRPKTPADGDRRGSLPHPSSHREVSAPNEHCGARQLRHSTVVRTSRGHRDGR